MKTEPWAHQRQELGFWDQPARALLWQMRSGKTKAVIDTLGGWWQSMGLRTAFIVAPLGVHANWADEFNVHAAYFYDTLVWYSAATGRKWFKQACKEAIESDFLTIVTLGKEAIITKKAEEMFQQFVKRGKFALIVDESHHFGGPTKKRTEAAIRWSRHPNCVMKRILSGTATGNSPMRLFSQFEILGSGLLGFGHYDEFEEFYAKQKLERTWKKNKKGEPYEHRFWNIVGFKNQEALRSKIALHSSNVLRSDCPDLPPLMRVQKPYQPSAKQMQAYNRMKTDMLVELESGSISTAQHVVVRIARLQQILSNFLVDVANTIEHIDKKSNPRMDALLDTIDGPTIVWCRYKEDIRQVTAALRKAGHHVVEYHGDVSAANRRKALEEFKDVFVGQPSCAGEGLDLSVADTIVWYSHTFDCVVREQADERASKVGKKAVGIVDIVAPGTIDGYILSMLKKKHKIAEFLTGQGLKEFLENGG